MRAMKLGMLFGGLALLLGFSPSASQAQARRGPPMIRIYSDNGVDYVGTSTYITPRIELSENAYVFAVEMDMDGQIQVLHPDMPGISVRINANRSLRLPNFFVGFNSVRYGGVYDAMGRDYYGGDDSRGTVIALASRAPFNLERIESYGDWDLAAIRRLIQDRSPLSAADQLARYLGQPGEPIGRDYLRFEGGRASYPYYASGYDYYSPCSAYYGYSLVPGLGFSQLQTFALFSRLRSSGRGVQVIGFDSCGLPVYGFVNSQPQPAIGHFPPRPPRGRGDTTVFPKSRAPKAPIPRGTTVFANTLDAGMPSTRAGALPQMGDVTVKATPTRRRYEPSQYSDPYSGGGVIAAPQGRVPVERVTIPRGEATASGGGARTVPQYHPEPRVEAAPARTPERTSSPPVIHERPSSPPPPPPRVETSTTRSEAPRTPPPSKGH